ncbi:MAG: ferrous iron transporter B, partial [Clostridia bacterium]|nr:ferrous iron transporter B [Clostridia bacterium]
MENAPIRIALAGNPNSGKTTLFNALTGSNQFVGNWPGVTVEKKEGKLKKRSDVTVTDLPGIYSLSPYTLEEVVARNYLVGEHPEAILNIVDGTNLERNLYLTTQLIELGIPVVVAINMMDVVEKKGDTIRIDRLSSELGCPVFKISALKETGIDEAIEAAINAAGSQGRIPRHIFGGDVEHVIAHIEEAAVHDMPEDKQRWYAIKIFERDEKVMAELALPDEVAKHIESDIAKVEGLLDDDAESIITDERYKYVGSIIRHVYKKKEDGRKSVSDKIDQVVTNRFAALPIFALIMFLVYYISVSTIGTIVTDWTNDGVFGEGWRFLGIGTHAYEEAMDSFATEHIFTDDVRATVQNAVNSGVMGADDVLEAINKGSFGAFEEAYVSYSGSLSEAGFDISAVVDTALESDFLPDPSTFGAWIPGIPVLLEGALDAVNCADWLKSLILDGIVGGVGAVLGFVPQ